MNKRLSKRLNLEQAEARLRKEGSRVVKGTNKRVVVVKSPDPKIFEQAIFIVREGGSEGNGAVNILREAEKVASDYLDGLKPVSRRALKRLPAPVFALIGALLTGAVWLTLHLIGI